MTRHAAVGLAYTVTPLLQVGERASLPAVPTDSVDEAARLIESGRRVLVTHASMASATLVRLEVDADEAEWRARQRPRYDQTPATSPKLPPRTTITSFDHLFPEDAGPVRPVPFPRAPRARERRPYEVEPVQSAIRYGRTQLVDPRVLLATQTGITRPGVGFYLRDDYPTRGDTYQGDRDPGNRLPLVYIRDGCEALILAGHHRSTAALIRGAPLEAIVVEGGWGPSHHPRRERR